MSIDKSKNYGSYQLKHAHAMSVDDVVSTLSTNSEIGLTTSEVELRKNKIGFNEIITKSPSIWRVYLAPLFDTLITVYLIITAIMVVLTIFVEGLLSKVLFWLIMISFNFLMAIFQQFRAQKKVKSLSSLSPPTSKVIRNGFVSEIDAKQLVPGDLIKLELGDRIPADARIVESNNLTINEASLTGESVAVMKLPSPSQSLPHDTPIAKHENMLYLGSYVQSGAGTAIVVQTGNLTELGQIATQMADISDIEIPLKNKVNALGKGLSLLMLTFLLILVLSTSIRRINTNNEFTFQQFAEDLSFAIINAMSVLPINIPLLTTIVLISGVLNMANKQVLIKKLSAVETLGRCSVLCSDKTGTITTGKMSVKLLWNTQDYYQISLKEDFSNKIYKIEANEIDDELDDHLQNLEEINLIDQDSALELLITCAILNNDANLSKTSKPNEFKIIGNFTDGALLVLARTNGLNLEYVRNRYERMTNFPFDSSLKRMSGLYKDTLENDLMIFTKGAPEMILPLCDKIGDESNVQDLSSDMKSNLIDKINKFTNAGYRVISFAYKPIDNFDLTDDNSKDRSLIEQNLTFIGFSVIYDPPRPNVTKAVSNLDSASIFPIMITGDSKSTAATIAKQVGILDNDEIVIEGNMVSKLSDEEFFKVSVFARVAPKDKEIIVNRYQQRGDIVAMTGDGVNDALAITRSDTGIAMGIAGTEVAKEAADIILSDDSYVSLVEGVREGRNLYNKIRMMIFFYIAVNLAEAVLYFSTSFILDFYLLNNWQRVYIFGIVHAIPVLAIIFGPDDSDVMLLKPRQNDSILNRPLIILLSIFALSTSILLIFSYFLFYNNLNLINTTNFRGFQPNINYYSPLNSNSILQPENITQAKARTILITIIYIIECIFVYSIIRVNRPINLIFEEMNMFVHIMVFLPLLVHFSIMYILPIQLFISNYGIFFDLIQLSIIDLIYCLVISFTPIILMEYYKKYIRKSSNPEF